MRNAVTPRGCFTDVVPHSLKSYRYERATERRRLNK